MEVRDDAKLLLEAQEAVVVTPVGSHVGTPVDVRVVAATNRNLKEEIAAGRLREDLYHRVAGHVIGVPPLAARRLDVPELFVHFLARIREDHPEIDHLSRAGRSGRSSIPSAFFADLMAAPWPGNVRQLENVTERTARLNLRGGGFRSPQLRSLAVSDANLTSGIHNARKEPRAEAGPEDSGEHVGVTAQRLDLAHKTVTRLFPAAALGGFWEEAAARSWTTGEVDLALERAATDRLFGLLETHGFNQTLVAQVLSMSRTTLAKLMERFGLPRASDFDLAQLESALVEAAGDAEGAARSIRLSPRSFKKRLTLLRLALR